MMSKKVIRVAVVAYSRKVLINGSISEEKILNAVDTKMTHLFAQGLGLPYELVTSADNEMGRLLPNGTWTGMMGMVLRGDADFAIKMALIERRFQALPFTSPYIFTDVTFITQKPIFIPDMTTLLHPFTLNVWLATILSTLIMPFILYILLSKRYNISKLLFVTYSTFLRQEFPIVIQKISDYLVAGFWLMAMMILGCCYTALLLSFLTFPPLLGVRSIPELAAAVKKGTHECISYPGTNIPLILMKKKNSSQYIIGENILSNPGANDIASVLRMSTRSRKIAFVGGVFEFFPLKDKYLISEDKFYQAMLGIPHRKDFCCKRKLNKIIGQLTAGGLIEKLRSDYVFRRSLPGNMQPSDDDPENLRNLSLTDLQGIFVFLLGGYALSMLAFMVEIIAGKAGKNKILPKKSHRKNNNIS